MRRPRPPWVKLHASFWDDQDLSSLTPQARLLALCLVTLSFESDPVQLDVSSPSARLQLGFSSDSARLVPYNLAWLSRRSALPVQAIRSAVKALSHAGFITLIASNVLAKRAQDASNELSTETNLASKMLASRANKAEREGEREINKGSSEAKGPLATGNGFDTVSLPFSLAQLIEDATQNPDEARPIIAAARGLPEAAIARAHESLLATSPKGSRAAYVVATLNSIRTETSP